MSSPSSSPVRKQSWIPPSFAWTYAPDVFCIDVPRDDPEVVTFISTGALELGSPFKLQDFHGESISSLGALKPNSHRKVHSIAHCHGVFLLPDDRTLCVVVGQSKPLAPDTWIPAELKAVADEMLLEHQSKAAELTTEGLLPSLPRAAKFPQPASGDPEKLARAASTAIAASGWPPSRDGNYAGILPGAAGRRTQALVSWVPHTGLPSYPEVRWAVQKCLPAALLKPRIEQMGGGTRLPIASRFSLGPGRWRLGYLTITR